jgi:sulfur dioxygenase
MDTIQLFDDDSSTFTYVLPDASGATVIIDPVDRQFERDVALLTAKGLRLVWIIETHVHADHITSASRLAGRTGARVAVPRACGVEVPANHVVDDDVIAWGAQRLRALHTPGHTAGSTCYLWETATKPQVFTGDTLLIDGCGRTDFQSGDAGRLYDSIVTKLFALSSDTIVWPGHDYHGRTRSTIGRERAHNPRLAGKSRDQFVDIMGALQLGLPTRIHEAVPANLRLGQ